MAVHTSVNTRSTQEVASGTSTSWPALLSLPTSTLERPLDERNQIIVANFQQLKVGWPRVPV